MRAPWLPRAALARWQATPPEDVVAGALARMVCSGGRVGGLLIEAGLCELADIAACVQAQLTAGPMDRSSVLYHDLELDLALLGRWLELDAAARLSAQVVAVGWLGEVDGLHADVATRLIGAGRAAEAPAVLERISWHTAVLDWLEAHGQALTAEGRAEVTACMVRKIEATTLAPEYRIELYARVAVWTGEVSWLTRAREVLGALQPGLIEDTPDVEAPAVSLARAWARLGDVPAALAAAERGDAGERWAAWLAILPWAPDRGAMLASLCEQVPWERAGSLLEAAPELGPRVLRDMLAMDAEACAQELGRTGRSLRGAQARAACAWLLSRVDASAVGSERWVDAWQAALDVATAAGCGEMIEAPRRAALIDVLLARPDIELWAEAASFVPDVRVEAVLGRSYAQLTAADHYMARERAIALGLAVLGRAPAEAAERWLALAATQLPCTSMDGGSLAALAAWSPAQQREVVLALLARHQHEFLVRHMIGPWLQGLARALPPRLWPDWDGWLRADELERVRRRGSEEVVVPEVTPRVAGAWPTSEQVVGAVAALGEESTAAARGLVALLTATARG